MFFAASRRGRDGREGSQAAPSSSEIPPPAYKHQDSLNSKTIKFPYTPFEQKLLKLLSRTTKSRQYSSLRWLLLFLLAFLCSNLLFVRTTENKATALSLALLFFGKYVYVFIEDCLILLLGAGRRRLKLLGLRQTNRYPQLPLRRQHKFAMLGPTQWMRWQCYQDAVFHFFLSMIRMKYVDIRSEYENREKTFDLSGRKKGPDDDDGFWFDFVADTGDSFNSTYTVAQCLTRDLELPGMSFKLPSSSLLLHGGDISYPWPQAHEMW